MSTNSEKDRFSKRGICLKCHDKTVVNHLGVCPKCQAGSDPLSYTLDEAIKRATPHQVVKRGYLIVSGTVRRRVAPVGFVHPWRTREGWKDLLEKLNQEGEEANHLRMVHPDDYALPSNLYSEEEEEK